MTWRFHFAIVHVWLGCVIHEIVGEEFFENSEVPFALHFLGVSPDNGLGGFGCSDFAHCL